MVRNFLIVWSCHSMGLWLQDEIHRPAGRAKGRQKGFDMNYKLLKKKGDLSTLRKVVTAEEKPTRKNLGIVGTVSDLREARILEQYNGPDGLWCFLSEKGRAYDRFAPSREEALTALEDYPA